MKFKKDKMKELIHYIINKCDCKNNVGKTVLYKLMYFSDFDFFELNEKSITGETYIRYPNGPVPEHFEQIKNQLILEKKIAEEETPMFTGAKYNRYKYSSLSSPTINSLDKSEVKIIDSVIKKLSHMTGSQISEYSHFDMPWRAAKDYEPLIYEFVFYRNDPYSVREK